MARYIDADKLEFETKLLKDNENELTGMNGVALIGKRAGKTIQLYRELFKQMIENAPTEDVVPRSKVEKLRARAFEQGKRDNVYGLTAEELAKKCEQLSIELEAMRGAANSYKMHYEKAKQEVEKADKEIERLTKILENYALQYGTVTDKQKVIEQAKQEVAREIFEEFDNLIVTLEIGDNEKVSVLDYNKYTELKKKYIGET